MRGYLDYGTWLRRRFPFKVQKLAVDGGFTCPNHDGRLSTGGCVFCDNRTFSPSYCNPRLSVSAQLDAGKRFFSHKYPSMRYLAYFQSYSNTYAPLPKLRELYEEALAVDGIVGLVIATRPDCVDDEVLDYLQVLSRRTFVMVESGVESANDQTLRRINRGHDFACSRRAIEETHRRGICVGAHVILGLPGEDAGESLRQADILSSLPIDVLKLHQLQIVRGTALAKQYLEHPFPLYTAEEYADLVAAYIGRLPQDMALERFVSQSPPDMILAPHWGLKPAEFQRMVEERIKG